MHRECFERPGANLPVSRSSRGEVEKPVKFRCVAYAVALLLGAGTANAGWIDFTTAADWVAGDGVQTFSSTTQYGEVSFVATPPAGLLNFTDGIGLGIDCSSCGFVDVAELIDDGESVFIQFLDGPVTVYAVQLTDMAVFEFGKVLDDENTAVWMFGDMSGETNQFSIGLEVDWIRVIPLTDSNFGLAAINVGSVDTPIPEPGSSALFSIGALLVAFAIRQRSL